MIKDSCYADTESSDVFNCVFHCVTLVPSEKMFLQFTRDELVWLSNEANEKGN